MHTFSPGPLCSTPPRFSPIAIRNSTEMRVCARGRVNEPLKGQADFATSFPNGRAARAHRNDGPGTRCPTCLFVVYCPYRHSFVYRVAQHRIARRQPIDVLERFCAAWSHTRDRAEAVHRSCCQKVQKINETTTCASTPRIVTHPENFCFSRKGVELQLSLEPCTTDQPKTLN